MVRGKENVTQPIQLIWLAIVLLRWRFMVIFFSQALNFTCHLPIGSRVYSSVRPCGISAICKNMPHKIYFAASNGGTKKYTQG